MAQIIEIKPDEQSARDYADRLILRELARLHEVVKPSELSDPLKDTGLNLEAVRSLLASNPDRFAYVERRWVPAGRIEGLERPLNERLRILVHRFGGPMPVELLARDLADGAKTDEQTEETISRFAKTDPRLLLTDLGEVALADWCFNAHDETVERAMALNKVNFEDVESLQRALGRINWRKSNSISSALQKAAPVDAKTLGAVAWLDLSPQDPHAVLLYDWRSFYGALFSQTDYVYGSDGQVHPEDAAKKWLRKAVKVAEKIAPTIQVEDADPLELKKKDLDDIIKQIKSSDESIAIRDVLRDKFEITPSVKTFPDDLANVKKALQDDKRAWWVGGDRFRQPDTAPEFIYSLPEVFEYVYTDFVNEEGELVDIELSDEGLSSSLRKLLMHPLATDVLDEDELPPVRQMPETVRCVLKPIHRELGTFPLGQFPTDFFDDDPNIQEVLLVDSDGRELQAWLNHEARLLFNMLEWFLDQPVESGAVFSLTRTSKPNVFEFAWLDQTDPVVYISSQRMEELREIAAHSDQHSTFDMLREVMSHWPKGADFLTILWELNVVRRTSRRMVASLLSGYNCFYQRSGSPVWHYDQKKVEQGFDKTKEKFLISG